MYGSVNPQERAENSSMDAVGGTPEEASSPVRTFPKWLIPYVPEESHRVWTIINNIFAITGCFLVLDLILAQGDVSERPFASGFYVLFNFSTCLVWVVESGLSFTYQHFHLVQRTAWYTKLELIIAVYFAVTTFVALWTWKVDNGKMAQQATSLWEVALDTSFYIYLSIRSWRTGYAVAQEADTDANAYEVMPSGDTGFLV